MSNAPLRLSSLFVLGVCLCCTARDAAAQGVLRAWGHNNFGQFGNGGTSSSLVPVPAGTGLHNVIAVACGRGHALALLSDGTVRAFGLNNDGQLGNGTTASSFTPVQVVNLRDVIAIECGTNSSYAIRSDGTVWAWGDGVLGALGHNVPQLYSSVPVPVDGVTDATSIGAINNWGIVARSDGSAWGWGYDFCLQIGPITTSTVIYPARPVSGLTAVVAVAAGGCHSLALLDNGTVRSLGANDSGQMGDGTTNGSASPVMCIGAGIATAIAAGGAHSMSLRIDGTVRTWGKNVDGQLGNGTNSNSTTPITVPGLTNMIAIDAGPSFSLAIRNDGQVFTWGYNANGELGVGTIVNSNVPLPVNMHAMAAKCGTDFVIAIVEELPCPADIAPPTHDSLVNIDDLIAVINNWGVQGSAADINGDGTVDIDDLLAVINQWGNCPP